MSSGAGSASGPRARTAPRGSRPVGAWAAARRSTDGARCTAGSTIAAGRLRVPGRSRRAPAGLPPRGAGSKGAGEAGCGEDKLSLAAERAARGSGCRTDSARGWSGASRDSLLVAREASSPLGNGSVEPCEAQREQHHRRGSKSPSASGGTGRQAPRLHRRKDSTSAAVSQ